MQIDELISSSLPPVSFAIAYGSFYLAQNNNTKPKMLDLIIGIAKPEEWHAENIQRNPEHYSTVKYLGSRFISSIQDMGGLVYYNRCMIKNQSVKYGCVKLDLLRDELRCWNNLYLSGRMHKPTLELVGNEEIRLAQEENLRHAVTTALLLLPSTFSEQDLYMALAGISYSGDIRMGLAAESPTKVRDIVYPQIPAFRQLYARTLKTHFPLVTVSQRDPSLWCRDTSRSTTEALVASLPIGLRNKLHLHENFDPNEVPAAIQKGIYRIVGPSSVIQPAKGVFSMGLIKAITYGLHKLKRGLGK